MSVNSAINCGKLILGGNRQNGNIDIVSRDPNSKIFVNGIEPGSGGSGGSPPISGVGDITITGNVTASGDGVTSGKIESQSIKSIGNMVCDGNLSVPTGNINLTTGSLQIPSTSTNGINIAGSGDLSINSGDILMSSGNLTGLGTNKITSGSGGLESHGDIVTIGAHDLIVGRDIYFDGNDIYKRDIVGGVPVDTSYKIYKGLVGKNDNNIFTGTNDFANAVRLGTESGGVFTESGLTLNTSGTLQSVNINNTTLLQCGNINCGNGGTNEIRCKKIKTRTNEDDVNNPDGWTITQQKPSNPVDGFDKVLDLQAGETGGFCVVRSLDSQTGPNITLDPRTDALGGRVVCNEVALGNGGSSSFTMGQPKSGADVANALLKLGTSSSILKFQDSTGNVDLMTLQQEVGTGDGLLLIRAIEFETNGNRIYQLRNGLTNLNVYFKQATEFHEFIFEDNSGGQIIRIRKTQVEFKENMPILFGAYPFQPIQYTLTRTITIRSQQDTSNYTNMVFNALGNGVGAGGRDSWTRVNDGATNLSLYNSLLEGFYKCSITQTSASSSNNFIGVRIVFDYILAASVQDTPDITPPISFGFNKMPASQADPQIIVNHNNSQDTQSQPVFLDFPSQNAGETMSIEVRLTKLDF